MLILQHRLFALAFAFALMLAAACSETPARGTGDGRVHDALVLNCPAPSVPPKSCADGWCKVAAGGCFTMGSPEQELCRDSDEHPHQVMLRRGFEISATEVSQQSFTQLMGYAPSKATTCGGDCPVENVSWSEAAAYCNALSQAKGLAECYTCTGSGATVTCLVASSYATGGKTSYDCPGYRFPTEAEWEFAARAGAGTALHNGDISSCLAADSHADAVAWYQANSNSSVHKVGQKLANNLGLSDMSGNVEEWTGDWYTHVLTAAAIDPVGPIAGNSKTVRGGSFRSSPNKLRMAFRTQQAVEYRSDQLGFRCVRSVP